MAIKVIQVENLGEYYTKITWIARQMLKKYNQGKQNEVPAIWFRAEASFEYSLVPSLYRNNWNGVSVFYKSEEKYSDLHYAEDIRTQHYHAKNYHYLKKEPSSRIEFLEVMQHHGVKTRLLDWSESSTHSLLFALEPFFSNKAYNFNERDNINPCVWVLDPCGLNLELFGFLGKQKGLLKNVLKELQLEGRVCNEVIERIGYFSESETMKKYADRSKSRHIDYIINLSEIYDELVRNRSRIKALLEYKEGFNPLYYVLSRIYADGYLLDNYKIPPLAVVQPYHSERIRAQRGVFTVFPFYESKEEEDWKDTYKWINLSPESMSLNEIARKHLYKIILKSPQKIAYEILSNGMNESWLYPEMPVVSNEIEYREVY